MPQGVLSNPWLLGRATAAQAELNDESTLRLFVNDLEPAPDTAIGSFSEASFTGYSAVDLAGLWESPVLIQAGEYSISVPTQTFTCTSGSPQTVYGWYIRVTGWFLFAQRFAAPVIMGPGSSLPLSITVPVMSRSILP